MARPQLTAKSDFLFRKQLDAALDYLATATGWGTYTHNGATQSLTAGVKATLTNNKGVLIETQKPSDVTTFYDGSVITGRTGDGVAIGIELTFTPTSNGTFEFVVSVDIGGSIGELYAQSYPVEKGSGVGHKIAYSAIAYQLDTWQANGGAVKVVCSGAGNITAVRYVIQRTHRAI